MHFKNTLKHDEYMYFYNNLKDQLDTDTGLNSDNGSGYSFKRIQHQFEV